MNPKIELLAPGGDVDAIKAAIIAGANAVYCGLDNFNARNRASNISFDALVGVIRLAHQYDCEIFLTLNIVILEKEFPTLAKLLSKLVNTTLDGVIVQDIGMFNLIKKHFPTLDIHASTQMTTHNIGQIPFLKKLGASRVNLSRELNLREITAITKVSREHDVLTEVFVHGSLCVAFSGLCYSTSASAGNSGNRGRCSQACREEYETTESGHNFPLNIKDNSAFFDLPALIEAGVYSFKVEGRIKGASYVHTVIDSFRKQIDGFLETGELLEDGERLYKVFNRDFSNAFLRGDLNQSMFIDNPRDNSKNHAIEKAAQTESVSDASAKDVNRISVVQIQEVKQTLYQEKNELHDLVREKIQYLSIDKIPTTLAFSGEEGSCLTLTIKTHGLAAGQSSITEDGSVKDNINSIAPKTIILRSEGVLSKSEKNALDEVLLEKRFRNLGTGEYCIADLDVTQLGKGLSLPFRDVTALKNEAMKQLNGEQSLIPEVVLPKLTSYPKSEADKQPALSLLICDEADVQLVDETDADIYFKLPDAYKRNCTKYVGFLKDNPRLIPWFPAVLIGKDYDVAVNILEQVMPPLIVTNNTGIAYKANELGIKWIAGPFLNTTNSYALMAMKEDFDCYGAFISNELNRMQMKNIARPQKKKYK